MPVKTHSLPALKEPYLDWFTPPLSTEDRLLRIRILGERIARYVEFMCAVGQLEGSSAEAKQNAVAGFYERLSAMERQLGRIHSDLQLG